MQLPYLWVKSKVCSFLKGDSMLGNRVSAIVAGLSLAVFVSMAATASAATYYWDPTKTGGTGGGGAGTWNTASWWTGAADAAWANGNDAVFGGSASGVVTLSASVNATSLTFNTAGYTLSGSSLAINTSAITWWQRRI